MSKTIIQRHRPASIPAEGELHAKHFNDAEIRKRAEADPEAALLTPEQLAKFKRANPFAGRKKR